MSSRTPEECVALAVDKSANQAAREEAIHALKQANECDELVVLVRRDDLTTHNRQLALRALATPQCDSTLRVLVEDESLEAGLQTEARELLDELEDS